MRAKSCRIVQTTLKFLMADIVCFRIWGVKENMHTNMYTMLHGYIPPNMLYDPLWHMLLGYLSTFWNIWRWRGSCLKIRKMYPSCVLPYFEDNPKPTKCFVVPKSKYHTIWVHLKFTTYPQTCQKILERAFVNSKAMRNV